MSGLRIGRAKRKRASRTRASLQATPPQGHPINTLRALWVFNYLPSMALRHLCAARKQLGSFLQAARRDPGRAGTMRGPKGSSPQHDPEQDESMKGPFGPGPPGGQTRKYFRRVSIWMNWQLEVQPIPLRVINGWSTTPWGQDWD